MVQQHKQPVNTRAEGQEQSTQSSPICQLHGLKMSLSKNKKVDATILEGSKNRTKIMQGEQSEVVVFLKLHRTKILLKVIDFPLCGLGTKISLTANFIPTHLPPPPNPFLLPRGVYFSFVFFFTEVTKLKLANRLLEQVVT